MAKKDKDLKATYKTPLSLIALVGPSGVGKSAIINCLLEMYPDEFAMPKSVTTRARRDGETDEEYQFVDTATFEQFIKNGLLLEYSTYAGHYYGLLKCTVDEIIAQGKYPLRAMDFNGAKNAKAVSISIDRDTDALLEVLLNRGMTDADIVTRLRQLPEERSTNSWCNIHVRNDGLLIETCADIYSSITGKPQEVVKAEFTSVWDGGQEVTTKCKVNLATHEVFDIKVAKNVEDGLDMLEREYVTINGVDHDVFELDEAEGADYWYR